MEMLQENLWLFIGLVGILILTIIIIVSVIIGKKRKREVEELDRLFPDGGMDSDNVKISVEKVRRHTLERERRKAKNIIHRERPKEGEKVLPDEDKEIIIRDPSMLPPKSRPVEQEEAKRSSRFSLSRSKGTDQAKEMEKESSDALKALSQVDESMKEKSFNVCQTTRKAVKESKAEKEKESSLDSNQKELDPATSRRMYKRSLLKDRSSESGEMPKASLIDSSMVQGSDANSENQASKLSRSSKNTGNSWFKK